MNYFLHLCFDNTLNWNIFHAQGVQNESMQCLSLDHYHTRILLKEQGL